MGDLELRASTADDVGAMFDVVTRESLHSSGQPSDWTAQRLAQMRTLPGRDPAGDFPVVVLGETVVGWVGVIGSPPYSEVYAGLHLDPELPDDDAARATELLIAHATGRALARAAGTPPLPRRTLAVEVLDSDVRLRRNLEALGFRRDREEHELVVDLSVAPAPPAWPAGVMVGPVRVPEDVDTVATVLTDAFADHPGDLHVTAEFLAAVLAQDDFRPDASALVHDATGPVGVILSRTRPTFGYVWLLGVVSGARRRGLGEQLLRHAFHAFASSGASSVQLDVDGGNSSGALTLYEKVGMTTRTTRSLLTRALAP